jgi:hypothetical protein
MQTFYESEYINESKMYTAKIQKHYSKDHEQRPRSINCAYRKQFYTQRNWNQNMKNLGEEGLKAVNHNFNEKNK